MSGFYPLVSGMDALGASLALIDAAEKTIDAQYFLMKSDSAGLIFVNKLLAAADRGVRVRLLLDDVLTSVNDDDDRVKLFPATGEVISDNPEKLLNKVSVDQQVLVTRMAEVVANAEFEVIVVTPYFIPGADGVEFWRRLTERSVRVVLLTNSLASNNHIPVHAAYARYRHRLIQAGVELYELRVDAETEASNDGDVPIESLTLHTKAIAIDRQKIFVGSLNLDPRAIDINTEMGVLVDSPDMTGRLTSSFIATLPNMAYRVVENESGQLRWKATIDGQESVEKSEPQAGAWRRVKAFFSKILPESQL